MSVHEKLPHGDVGRIVNSFVSVHHKDAINWQRKFRERLYIVRKKLPFVNQVNGIVHLITVDNIERRYEGNLVRLPDYRRILPLTHCITPEVGLVCSFNPLLTRTNFLFSFY